MRILSDRFRKFIRKMTERFLGIFYEGPAAPIRLEQNVKVFAALNPHATVGDWVEFSSRFAEESYRAGYQRGLEWAERDLDRRDPVTDPEHMLDQRRHEWSWVDLAPSELEMQRIVEADPFDALSPEDRALALDSVGRYLGGYRVSVVDTDDPKKR